MNYSAIYSLGSRHHFHGLRDFLDVLHGFQPNLDGFQRGHVTILLSKCPIWNDGIDHWIGALHPHDWLHLSLTLQNQHKRDKRMSIIDDNWWSLIIECCLPASKRYIQCGSICIVMILIFKKNNRSSMITSSNYFQNTKFQKRLSFFLRLERCTPLMRKINSIKYYVRVLCECYNSILVYDTRKFIWIIIWLSHIYCIAIL